MKKDINFITAVQPTNYLTLGNYLGAIDEVAKLQNSQNGFLFIADLHAMTLGYNPKTIHESVYSTLAMYLACGIDPKKITTFLQSAVPAHSELKQLISPYVSINDLNRMHQLQDKSANKHYIPLALVDYPVLMAADILLYNPDFVPVGIDQVQHLELTRDIAKKINDIFGQLIFKIPDMKLSNYPKVYALQDPHKKMSKSDLNTNNTIFLTDPKDSIAKKVKRATTDSYTTVEYSLDNDRAGLKNLIDLYCHIENINLEDFKKNKPEKYGHLKEMLIESIAKRVLPIQTKYFDYLKDRGQLIGILKEGTLSAQNISHENLNEYKRKTGILYF